MRNVLSVLTIVGLVACSNEGSLRWELGPTMQQLPSLTRLSIVDNDRFAPAAYPSLRALKWHCKVRA